MEYHGRLRQRWTKAKLLAILLPVCSLLTVIGPDVFPLVNIRAFLLLAGLFLLLLGAWHGVKKRKCAAFGALIAGLIAILPPLRSLQEAQAPRPGKEFLKVAQVNVHQENRSFPEVIAAIRGCGADLVSIQEVDSPWNEALVRGLSDVFPYEVVHVHEDHYGIALFSRVPLQDAEVFDLLGLPAIRAVVQENGARAMVFAVHLRSPEGNADVVQRNAQWVKLGEMVDLTDKPVIVIGDLNTVPWDDAFRHFQKETSLTFGLRILYPTWPSFIGMALVRLDHLFVSSSFSVQDERTFSIPGSDHRGLVADVVAVSEE